MTDTTALRPVAAADRHLSLDILRGLGVMGILAVNAVAFGQPLSVYMSPELSPFPLTGTEAGAWWVVQTFFHYKFVTLFSMLFGVSILLVGGERSDKPRGALLRRRLSWLLVFGLLHGLVIWYGDILMLYAVTGFLVMLMRSWSPRRLFTIGLTVVILGSVLAVGPLLALEYAPADVQKQVAGQMTTGSPESVRQAIEAMRGGLASAMTQNFKDWAILQPASLLVIIWRTGALMMIGMALYKWGFLVGRAPAWLYGLLVVVGAGSLVLAGQEANAKLAINFAAPQTMGRLQIAHEFLTLPITLGYASAAILAIKLGAVRWLLTPLAALGRMAFTNYLSQSLIMTTIFWSGRGLGLFGEFTRVELWGCVLAIWALQLVWSPLWLSRFSMGPLEWVWRRLTYGKAMARAG